MRLSAVTDHASLAVSNLDVALRFYEAAFGYELLFRDTQTELIAALTGIPGLRCALAQLRLPSGGSVLELVCFEVPPGAEDAEPVRVGHGHIAFRVADFGAALDAVTALGARPLGDTVTFATGRALYAREPAGSIFELYEPAGGRAPAEPAPRRRAAGSPPEHRLPGSARAAPAIGATARPDHDQEGTIMGQLNEKVTLATGAALQRSQATGEPGETTAAATDDRTRYMDLDAPAADQ